MAEHSIGPVRYQSMIKADQCRRGEGIVFAVDRDRGHHDQGSATKSGSLKAAAVWLYVFSEKCQVRELKCQMNFPISLPRLAAAAASRDRGAQSMWHARISFSGTVGIVVRSTTSTNLGSALPGRLRCSAARLRIAPPVYGYFTHGRRSATACCAATS